ncbi:oligosaccharide flippase family protein [Devosia sp. 2618]|uniref:lipopolysaccharide biosynthesis protein n=1 Tax=Devosia sp. 2618 TaxID=3156454 RepID=UPI00339765CC
MSSPARGGLIDTALAFGIRVLSAGLMFGLQVLLARLMPLDGYGGFVTIWTWMLALGSFAALGFAESSVRFLPRYRARGREGHIQGYWRYGLRLVVLVSGAVAVIAAGAALLYGAEAGPGLMVLLVALGLPFLAVEYYLEGIARSFGWFRLAAVPVYIIRPLLIAALCLGLTQAGVVLTLPVVGAVLVVSMAMVAIGVALVVASRLKSEESVQSSPRRQSLWLRASLPLLVVSGLEDLLSYSDVLVLSLLASPDEVAIYFAAARTLALANFVAYAVYLVSGRRFALDLASRDRGELQRSISTASRLTFWSTLAAVAVTLAVGPYLLAAFGAGFADGYVVMAILGAGLIAKSISGQAGELLVVTGRQREVIWLSAVVLVSSGALCFVLVPMFGIMGAAIATATTMLVRSLALIATVWRVEKLQVVALGLPLRIGV